MRDCRCFSASFRSVSLSVKVTRLGIVFGFGLGIASRTMGKRAAQSTTNKHKLCGIVLDHRAPPAMLADETMSNTDKPNDAVETALEMVAESRPRINGYTSEERARLEKEGRAMMATGQPSAGAVRAAKELCSFLTLSESLAPVFAAIIDRETHAKELRKATENFLALYDGLDKQSRAGEFAENARALLKETEASA